MNTTDEKFLRNGRCGQLQPKGFNLNNLKDKKEHMNSIIDVIFPNQITLKYKKGLRTKEHQMTLPQVNIGNNEEILQNRLQIFRRSDP